MPETVGGWDGRTYQNNCFLKCNDVRRAYTGAHNVPATRELVFENRNGDRFVPEVESKCGCDMTDKNTVFSLKGVQYQNACLAACDGV